MIPIVSLFSSESRDPSYAGLAKCPVCSRKHWRDTSCWIHPRESVMPNSTLKKEKVSWILSGKFFFMHWKIPHNFTRFTSGSKLLFFHQVVSNRGGSTGADPRGRIHGGDRLTVKPTKVTFFTMICTIRKTAFAV